LSVSDDNDTDEPLIVNVFDNTASSYEATTLTGVVVGTFWTFMPNVMLDAPTGTTMSGERPTAGLLVVSFTVAPAVDGAGVAGMGPLKVTVPVTLAPPVTLVALSVRLVIRTPGVFRLRTALAGTPVAAMIVFRANGTGEVLIVKLPVVAPAGIVMLAGTGANSGYWVNSGTIVPPAGAGPDSVIVPVTGLPPVTVSGVSDNEVGLTAVGGGSTVMPPFWPMPAIVA